MSPYLTINEMNAENKALRELVKELLRWSVVFWDDAYYHHDEETLAEFETTKAKAEAMTEKAKGEGDVQPIR